MIKAKVKLTICIGLIILEVLTFIDGIFNFTGLGL